MFYQMPSYIILPSVCGAHAFTSVSVLFSATREGIWKPQGVHHFCAFLKSARSAAGDRRHSLKGIMPTLCHYICIIIVMCVVVGVAMRRRSFVLPVFKKLYDTHTHTHTPQAVSHLPSLSKCLHLFAFQRSQINMKAQHLRSKGKTAMAIGWGTGVTTLNWIQIEKLSSAVISPGHIDGPSAALPTGVTCCPRPSPQDLQAINRCSQEPTKRKYSLS